MEKKAHRGRIWNVMGNEQLIRGMWEYVTLKKGQKENRFWKMRRGRGKKEYKVSGNRNPLSERFWSKSEEVWMWDVVHQMMRKGYLAVRDGRWEELKERYREVEKLSEWSPERIREAYQKVARD